MSAKAQDLRNNADEYDANQYADTDTSAYEEARRLQTEAHKSYMVAIGLQGISPNKTGSKPVTRKRKPAAATRRSHRATRARVEKAAAETPAAAEPAAAEPAAAETETAAAETAATEPADAETETAAAETAATEPAETAKWLKCRDKPLSEQQLAALPDAVKQYVPKSKHYNKEYGLAKYYCFAERVTRAYVMTSIRQKDEPLHLHREGVLRSAVSQVYDQIRPWNDKPHHGNVHMGMLTMLPVVEHVLELPCGDFTPGSKAWVKKLVETDR